MAGTTCSGSDPCGTATRYQRVICYRKLARHPFGGRSLHICHWKPPAAWPNRLSVRYFFHIVDRYGLFPDRTGFERVDHNSAALHVEKIAAELAKAGELFRSSIVFVSHDGVAKPS